MAPLYFCHFDSPKKIIMKFSLRLFLACHFSSTRLDISSSSFPHFDFYISLRNETVDRNNIQTKNFKVDKNYIATNVKYQGALPGIKLTILCYTVVSHRIESVSEA